MPPVLRAAAPDDLPACAELTADALADLARRQGRDEPRPPPEPMLPLLRHGFRLSPHGFHVAEEDGRIVAFSAAWARDGLWWLGFLFARPARQGGGVGRALLDRALAPGAEAPNAFTFASSDLPAVSLYLRAGMMPRAAVLAYALDARPEAPATHRLEPLRKSSLAFERERFGYARGHDHRYFLETGARGFEVARDDGTRAGFAYVQPDGLVGPVAVERAEDVAPALALAAREVAGPATLRVPSSNHEALRWCAAHAARLRGMNLLLARAPLAPLDLVLLAQPGLA